MEDDKLEVSHQVLKNEIGHLQKDVDELKETQKKILAELNRYKGVMGGIMLAGSAITALVTLAIGYFKAKA